MPEHYEQSEKGKATRKRYRQSEKRKAALKRYQQSEKGKSARKRYEQSEKGKAIAKRHRQSEKGKAALKRYQQSEKFKATKKRYRQSKKGRKVEDVAKERFKIRHPEQCKAREVVNNAIRDGKLPRPDSLPCHHCQAQAKEYHHHKGYEPEHWLDVVPICIKCHGKITSKT